MVPIIYGDVLGIDLIGSNFLKVDLTNVESREIIKTRE